MREREFEHKLFLKKIENMSSYWRVAGLNYLKYLQVCNATVRNALKEPMRTAAETRGAVHFREQAVVQGKRGPRYVLPLIFYPTCFDAIPKYLHFLSHFFFQNDRRGLQSETVRSWNTRCMIVGFTSKRWAVCMYPSSICVRMIIINRFNFKKL